MTKDPVCGMQVDEKNAPASSVYRGAFYGFCCEECKDKFELNPDRYAASPGDILRSAHQPHRTA